MMLKQAPEEALDYPEDSRPFVLVVDDDPTIRKLASLVLRNNYYVLEAGDPQMALRWLDLSALSIHSGSPIRVVLLDVMLPGLDGFRLCKLIKKVYQLPVIMLTSLAQEKDVQTAAESGADDYIAKPCSVRVLTEKVGKWVKKEA